MTSPSTDERTTSEGPTLVDDTVVAKAGKDTKIGVLGNDRSPGSKLDKDTMTIVSAPRLAEEFRVHGDHLHYRAFDDGIGSDRLVYRVCDGENRCGDAVVLIDIVAG